MLRDDIDCLLAQDALARIDRQVKRVDVSEALLLDLLLDLADDELGELVLRLVDRSEHDLDIVLPAVVFD